MAIIICLAAMSSFWFYGCRSDDDFQSTSNVNIEISTVKEKPTDGSTPVQHSPSDNYYIALGQLIKSGSFIGETEGVATAKQKYVPIPIRQKIKAYRAINSKEMYKESSAYSSFKGTAMQIYIKGNKYITRDADSVHSVDDITWEDAAQSISRTQFFESFGATPSSLTSYIVTDNTILSSEYLGFEDGLHGYRYTLDNELATASLQLEMRTMTGMKNLPIFESTVIMIYITDDWVVSKTSTDCRYRVDMLGGVTVNEKVTETFSHIGGKVSVPHADFFAKYL